MAVMHLAVPRQFVIYGAGFVGQRACEALRARGHQVLCFLDRRADSLPPACCGLPVLAPAPEAAMGHNPAEVIVFVAVLNWSSHAAICGDLRKLGYTYIVYKRECIGIESAYQSNAVYDSILDGKNISEFSIQSFTEKWYEGLRNHALPHPKSGYGQDEYKSDGTYLLPVDLLFTTPYALWYKQCISKLFELFRGSGEGDLGPYKANIVAAMEEYRAGLAPFGSDRARKPLPAPGGELAGPVLQRILSERQNIYQRLTLALDMDPRFFDRHPSQALRMERGGFLLEDGSHRAVFLMLHGRRHVPCRISGADYARLLNEEHIQPVIDHIRAHGIHSTPTPVPHPFFYLFPSRHENTCRTRLDAVTQFLSERAYALPGKKVLDLRPGIGHFARNFYRFGAEVTAYTPDDGAPLSGLFRLLNRLMGCEPVSRAGDDPLAAASSLQYHCALHFDFEASGSLSPAAIAVASERVLDHLFLELPMDVDKEAIVRRTAFRSCLLLQKTIKDGVPCGVFVCSK